jgi:hypothetical protein
MAEEIVALEHTNTWDLVSWVYRIKTRSDGSLEHYKARLVITTRLVAMWPI